MPAGGFQGWMRARSTELSRRTRVGEGDELHAQPPRARPRAQIGPAVDGPLPGESMDETSRRKALQATRHALETAEIGTGIAWENPANAGAPARGSTVITRQGVDQQGRTCREFQQAVTIGGEEAQSCGTACRDGNGDWKLVSG